MDRHDDFMGFGREHYDDEKYKREQEYERKREKLSRHPLLLQAQEICDLTCALTDTIGNEQERALYGHTLNESARALVPLISGVLGSSSWLLTMQNAAIIRYHGDYLLTSTSGLRMLESVDKQYVHMLKEEILHFRELFRIWARRIARMPEDPYFDDWGLFSTPD